MTKTEVINLVSQAYPDFVPPAVYWVGIRGYYKKTLGDPESNDRAIYDDALFIISTDDFVSFNGNCDPSRFSKGIATLKPGVWNVYKFDKHRGIYMALCQRAGKVTVSRDGKGDDTGMFGINIHRGGSYGTSSAGCQTIPPSQWEDFISTSMIFTKKAYPSNWQRQTYTYVLLEL